MTAHGENLPYGCVWCQRPMKREGGTCNQCRWIAASVRKDKPKSIHALGLGEWVVVSGVRRWRPRQFGRSA